MKRISTVSLFLLVFLSWMSGQIPVWDWISAIHSDESEIAMDVTADPITGDIYLVGEWNADLSVSLPADLRESVSFDSTYGGSDGFLIKLDKDGNLQWAFKVGGEGDDLIQAVHLDQYRNVYVTGIASAGSIRFSGTGTMTLDSSYTNTLSKDFFLARYDPDGNLLWYRHSEGDSNVEGTRICSNTSGVYIIGNFRGSASFGSLQTGTTTGNVDFFLVKYLAEGDEQWVITGHSDKQDFGNDIACDEEQVYLTGEYNGDSLILISPAGALSLPLINSSNLKYDIFLASFDNDGTLLSFSNITGPENEHGYALEVDQANIYLAGTLGGPASFPGYAGNPVMHTDGDDAFLCSISKTGGTTNWVRTFSDASNGDQAIRDISMDPERRLYFTGSFSVGITVDTVQAVSLGFSDVFVAAYDHEGNYLWFKSAGSSTVDVGHGISANYPGSLFVAGEYGSLADFDGVILPNDGNQELFAGRLLTPCQDAIGGTLTASDTTVCEGDSVALKLNGHYGYLQWQSSSPGMNDWSMLVTDLSDSIAFIPITSADYRALVNSGSCAPDSSNVIHVELLDPPLVEAGSDATINAGDTIQLNGSTGASVSWVPEYRISDPALPNPFVDPWLTTTYRLTVTDVNGCSGTDSVSITVIPPDFANAGSDQTICPGDSTRLQAAGGDSYNWEPDGSLDQSDIPDPWVRPLTTTTYVVHVTNSLGWVDSDTVTVFVSVTDLSTSPDIQVCRGTEVELSATGTGTFAWYPQGPLTTVDQPVSRALVDTTTTFTVVLTDPNGCRDSARITVTVFDLPIANAGPDQEINGLYETSLDASLETGETGTWSLVSGSAVIRDSNNPKSNVRDLETGDNVFQWEVTNGVCPPSSDQVIIRVIDILIPTVITPNGDGKNDFFHVEGIDRFPSSELVVLDRWGNVVYSAAPYLNNWNGTDQNGTELQEETFYIVLKYNEIDVYKGYLMIVR